MTLGSLAGWHFLWNVVGAGNCELGAVSWELGDGYWVLLIGPGLARRRSLAVRGAHLNEVNCTAKASLFCGPPHKFNFQLRQLEPALQGPRSER